MISKLKGIEEQILCEIYPDFSEDLKENQYLKEYKGGSQYRRKIREDVI